MKRFFISIFVLTLIAIITAVFFLHRGDFFSTDISQARLVINNNEFSVEIADTAVEQKQGLSGRDFLEPDNGMLFIFSQPGNYGFWMKDMRFPIDIIWIRGDKIIGFEKNAVPESYPAVFYPPAPADRVLEVVAGTAEKFNFKVGDAVKML